MTYVTRWITAAPLLAQRAAPLTPAESAHPELAPLISVLFHSLNDTRSLVVNLTAAHGGAGTSTVARRLAAVAATTGWCRVALLDARPGAAKAGHGLVEAAERGDAPALVPLALGEVSVDTGGLSDGTLSRLDGVRALYGMLRDRYALVIVDCPPALASQQTLTVASAADETVIVVEADRTALDDVARVRATLERRGAGVLGLVMNKRGRRRAPWGLRA